ncbi:DUF4232 domain-containing protein [Pseudofrankia saprophytica]|uniref:DUF4232 domain-containing protein n=1 Tax=Pseudofrankia saprophytica TaxID=298655 RepID=UPI00031C98B9|nr:DUF4232 domain-containing protein [Pseudofrankia saprophytica]OHV32428.1 hypothetical protein BCD49_29765 [Pseudofrankia sp. EUN1h]
MAAVALGATAGCSQPDPSAGFDVPSPTPTSPAPTPSPLAAAGSAPTTSATDDGATPPPATAWARTPPAAAQATGEPFATLDPADLTNPTGRGDTAAGDAPRCTGAGLTPRLGSPTQLTALAPGLTQFGLIITFVNNTTRTCAMYGFPGATLVTAQGDTYDLARRTTVMPASLRVPPGDGAAAVLTYLAVPAAAATPPAGDGSPAAAMPAFDARYLLVTPPDDRDPIRVDWPGGPVADQRRDAYPASYIGPVTR